MGKRKSSISKASSDWEIGEFWDQHSLADYWDKTREVHFDVEIEDEKTYYEVDEELSKKLQRVARKRGISSGALLNQWLSEKLKAKAA